MRASVKIDKDTGIILITLKNTRKHPIRKSIQHDCLEVIFNLDSNNELVQIELLLDKDIYKELFNK